MFSSSACDVPAHGGGIIQAASMANEQLDLQVRNIEQSRALLGKVRWASQMHTARLLEDQKVLRHMVHRVRMAHGRHSALMILPDMHQPWHRHCASSSPEMLKAEADMVLQELKEVHSSFIAASGCNEIWRRLSPPLPKRPAPEPESISGPRPDELPWPQRWK
eukprot:CAMPEP_0172669920 /NCGR_PEP_ID=MMETSP1074-20121228/9979_1 /TAXON_ID=2916 /ORGANISM="Ceratium fusus, Strain PA161109" /LENGTH=162 /DNA_ID=CAMNT_0013486757 /DNA_START=24 /DNA_END=512 /DNA_ORIENTATION=+